MPIDKSKQEVSAFKKRKPSNFKEEMLKIELEKDKVKDLELWEQ